MTSQRRAAEDRYDHILPFIQEAADEYYGGNLDRGFRHWAFATVFTVGHDVQGNDIIDATAIDGSDDFEVDSYFIPEYDDDSVVHLFQSKHREPSTTMGPRELAAFLNAPNRLLNPNEVAASRNEETKSLHEELVRRLTSGDRPSSVNMVWTTSGTLSPTGRRHAEENRSRKLNFNINGNLTEVTVTLECLDLSDLYQQHANQQASDDRSEPCDFTFGIEQGSYHQTNAADYRTLSMTVPVKQIIDVFAVHSYKIFRENPRGPLGNKVNSEIKRTLLDGIDRRRFHLLNNGITAICESYRLDGGQLSVRDFQIINGCQTTVTLWDVRAVVRDDPNVLVTVKLTECPQNPSFARTIANATNRQTALRAEDSISNEDVQNRLKREFGAMAQPWFYEVKRGDWAKMMGGASDKELYRDLEGTYRKLTSKEVAQAVVSFAGFPGEAKDKIRAFINKEPVSSIARESEFRYDTIYTENVAAAQLLLPAVIQRKVWNQVETDKSEEDWLIYSRFHIVWLIGNLLREYYQLQGNLFPAHRATTVAEQINDWFVPMYTVAVAAIRNTLQEAEARGTFTGNNKEFFRSASSYRLMESNLQGASRLARTFGNPFANLPSP
jgi:hypothetical protein